jgi:cytochrome P450
MLERQAEFGFSDIEAAYTVGALYIAAAGTTSATMMSFCLAMCYFPQWQERLQEEVDRVVGADRLPDFEDSPNLPLTRAIIKEVMRVWPVTAGGNSKLPSFHLRSIWLTVCIGFPHLLTQDDSFEGYFIPRGANVHANTW